MADVLLVTDETRLKSLFTRASGGREFSLRIAPTLAQGDEEIAASPPLCTFVECSISGLDSDDVVRYLRTRLPQGSRLTVLCADGDAESTAPGEVETLDISRDDDSLVEALRTFVHGARLDAQRGGELAAASFEGSGSILFSAPLEEMAKDAEKMHKCRPVLYTASLVAVIVGVLSAWHFFAAPPAQTAAPAKTAEYAKVLEPLPAAHPAPRSAAQGYLTYTVLPGDTIQGILLQRLGRSAKNLQRLLPEIQRRNDITDFKTIRPGQQIQIPVP